MTIKLNKDLPKNKATALPTQVALYLEQQPYDTKMKNIVKAIILRGKQGLNCFEAANRLHDYVLRSTVSDSNRLHGIYFERKSEKVPNSFGRKTTCTRYWLEGENLIKALMFLGVPSNLIKEASL